MVLDFFKKVYQVLEREQRLVLMVVVAHEGSSPGRKGFKMLVTKSQMHGTIGGGIMEHKLVEYARSLLDQSSFTPFLKHQIHDKVAPNNQSGMICSGQQSVAFYDVNLGSLDCIALILNSVNGTITYTDKGIEVNGIVAPHSQWSYTESIALANKVYIVGGGHVGLALSEVLSRLDFEIHLLDHRENLNTVDANPFVLSSQVIAFEAIEQYLPEGENIYVVIMSFGYRTDDIIIRRLLGKHFRYIGMLGSQEKIATLFRNLLADGFPQAQLDQVYAPIGIDIKSETTSEIAISIAAQLIKIKNQHQSHDRY
jgi:xanthine dehydrogenase accessory factor